MDEQQQETPEQTIQRAQVVIDTLREHLQAATDALVSQQVENKFMIRHIAALEKQIESLTAEPVEAASGK